MLENKIAPRVKKNLKKCVTFHSSTQNQTPLQLSLKMQSKYFCIEIFVYLSELSVELGALLVQCVGAALVVHLQLALLVDRDLVLKRKVHWLGTLVNPSKKSGCGWASVKYKGRKMDHFKAVWSSKMKAAKLTESVQRPDMDEGNSNSSEIEVIQEIRYIKVPFINIPTSICRNREQGWFHVQQRGAGCGVSILFELT